MTTAIITTDPFFGPWNIPARGQNMINNHYAHTNGLLVDTIIPEPLFSNYLSTTQWVAENKSLNTIILCSIHQIPDVNCASEDLINFLQTIYMHFSLEDIHGSGAKFLNHIALEKIQFSHSKVIDYRKFTSYEELHKLMLQSP